MPICPHCTGYYHAPSGPCECGRIDTDIQPTPDPEPAPQPCEVHFRLLGLLDAGYTREQVVTAFGGDRLAELTVRHALAFLGHRDRRYVSGWRITERGKQLLSCSQQDAA